MFDLLFVTASRTRQIAPAKLEPAMFFGGGRHQAGGTRWPQILPHFRRLCSPRGFCPRASSSTGRPRQMEVRICRRKRQQTTSPVAGEVGQRGCFEAARCVPAKTSLASKTPSFTGVSPGGSTPPPPPTSMGSPKFPRTKFETAQNIRDSEASRERFFGGGGDLARQRFREQGFSAVVHSRAAAPCRTTFTFVRPLPPRLLSFPSLLLVTPRNRQQYDVRLFVSGGLCVRRLGGGRTSFPRAGDRRQPQARKARNKQRASERLPQPWADSSHQSLYSSHQCYHRGRLKQGLIH